MAAVAVAEGTLSVRCSLTGQQEEILAKIAAYPFVQVREKVLKEGRVPEAFVDEAIDEFRKFLALIGLGHSGMGMISPPVDEIWHTFILFMRDYADFCNEVFGRFIHHQPTTSLTPASPKARSRMINAYREIFGELPAIWGVSIASCSEQCSASTNCQDADCGED